VNVATASTISVGHQANERIPVFLPPLFRENIIIAIV
jgi:hypothetical protein